MGSLQGPVVCPSVHPKVGGFCSLSMIGPMNVRCVGTEFWGLKEFNRGFLSCHVKIRKSETKVRSSLDSSSNGGGSMADSFDENDEDYVNSSVIEAVEMPSVLLMAAIRNVPIARPTLYQAVMKMIDKMGYQVRLVRVTRRVDEAYFAQLYLTKVGNEAECRSFDLRPSDAINIAVRCKVPIQVNKSLVYSDGMKVIESGKLSIQLPSFDGRLLTEMDKPNGQPCAETDEFNLLNNMMKAVVEERYNDAALWRDKLNQHRAGKNIKKRS
ncbi:bifunctional nuclease 1 isoform X2 [Lathyrus oleraceus]|uniref:bifunctional nuclease 1 isoform X2 n=1 Tax=Pisum sativum TaxID=3888 RepID=UPI0021D0F62B|nr:bifunctional nuclease 1-like isoform X2 [Pisum sativum]